MESRCPEQRDPSAAPRALHRIAQKQLTYQYNPIYRIVRKRGNSLKVQRRGEGAVVYRNGVLQQTGADVSNCIRGGIRKDTRWSGGVGIGPRRPGRPVY